MESVAREERTCRLPDHRGCVHPFSAVGGLTGKRAVGYDLPFFRVGKGSLRGVAAKVVCCVGWLSPAMHRIVTILGVIWRMLDTGAADFGKCRLRTEKPYTSVTDTSGQGTTHRLILEASVTNSDVAFRRLLSTHPPEAPLLFRRSTTSVKICICSPLLMSYHRLAGACSCSLVHEWSIHRLQPPNDSHHSQ